MGDRTRLPGDGSATPTTRELFGIAIENVTLAQAVASVLEDVRTRRGSRVFFVNAHCVNVASSDRAYRAALDRADRIFADGAGMQLAGRILGRPIVENVNGTDMFPRLCDALRAGSDGVFLLGGREGVADRVAAWVHREHAGVRIAGVRHGHFDAAKDAEVAAGIRASGAKVVLVAMGVPRQELWIDAQHEACGRPVMIGVGGLFDFYSGDVPRAPRWMRRSGLEWSFRLAQEPRRLWKRYLLGNWVFLARVLRQRLRS